MLFATVTPSLVIFGGPYGCSSTALRPFGPRVTFRSKHAGKWRYGVKKYPFQNQQALVERKLACNRSWGYTCAYFHFRMCTWTASASLSTPASIMPRPSVPKRRSLPAAAMRVACIERLGAARPAVCFTIERIICIAGMETYDEYFRTQSERAGSPP